MSAKGPMKKKNSQRTRRTVTPGTELARDETEAKVRIVNSENAGATMPANVSADISLSEIWESLAGDGSTFTPAEGMGLELMTYWLRIARECYDAVDDGQGAPLKIMDVTIDGELIDSKYMKLMDTATKNYMKLAEQMGVTPLARARLNLTETTAKGVAIDSAIRAAVAKSTGNV